MALLRLVLYMNNGKEDFGTQNLCKRGTRESYTLQTLKKRSKSDLYALPLEKETIFCQWVIQSFIVLVKVV